MAKTHLGIMTDHGHAPYKHDPQNNPSYYVELEVGGEKKQVWGVALQEAMENSDVKKGDMVVVNNLGSQPVSLPDPNNPQKSITTHKNQWEVARYEPEQNLQNAIIHDEERERIKDQQAERADEVVQEEIDTPKTPRKLSEFETPLPDSIKNNYYAITKNRFLADQKTNYYDKDDKNQVNIAFEEHKNRLNTSRQDEKTINAMLDLASSKGWTAVKLQGSEEFKQKAWLEASLRGIETTGYKPTERDEALLMAMKDERSYNTVTAVKVEPNVAEERVPEAQQEQAQTDELVSEIQADETQSEQELAEQELEVQQQTEQEQSKFDVKEIAIDSAKEAAIVAVTPPPLQPAVGAYFLAQDAKSVKEFIQEKVAEYKKQSAAELRTNVKELVQQGIKDGSIKSRDDLVAKLKAHGFEVVRTSEKSITLSNPNGKDLRLKGELFTKEYYQLQDLKKQLEPENLKATHPNLSDSDIAKSQILKQQILTEYSSTTAQQNGLSMLNQSVSEIAAGKRNIDNVQIPPNEVKPEISVRTPEHHEHSRSR